MINKQKLIIAVVTSAFALSTLGVLNTASADQDKDKEKCYGVVKAGKNDCAGAGHSCQGQAKKDSDPKEFIVLPAGTCARLTGGKAK